MKALIILTIAVAMVAVSPTGCSWSETRERETSPAASARVRTLDESNSDAEIRSGVVLLDFWAFWCGPCKMQAPIVVDVADRVEGKVKVAKLDVDAAPKVARRFNIKRVPTLVVFKHGKPEQQFVGVTKADTLVSAITSALDSK